MQPNHESSEARSVRAGPWPYLPWSLPIVAVLLSRLQVNDLAYQLRAGQIMWAERAVMRTDQFTYTVHGAAWLDQQWGAQLLLSGWYSLGGWRGFFALQALILAGSYGMTFVASTRVGASTVVAAGASLTGFAVASSVPGALAVRPQLLALPLCVLAAWIVHARADRPRTLLLLPAVSLLWANIHGSFVVVSVLLGIALVADLLGRARIWRWTALTLLASLLVPLANPWGPAIYGYVWRLATDPMVRTVISEWRPLWTQPAGALFAVACVGGVAALWRRRSRNPTLEEILVMAIFSALAITSARQVVWWSVVVPPAAVAPLSGWRPGGAWRPVLTRAVVAGLACILALGVARIATLQPSELLSEAPPGITAWLAQHPSDGRVFAEWWAPWFEYALPDRPMFTDARVELFPADIWNSYFDIVQVEPSMSQELSRWQIDTVVIEAGHHPELVAALAADPGWQLVYRDVDGSIFERAQASAPRAP